MYISDSNGRKLSAALAFILICAVLAGAEETRKVTVLFTTDLHGTILPHDYFNARAGVNSLARIATVARQIRAENPEMLLLDGGDTIQGNALMYAAARQFPAEANPIIAAMNAIGYDAMAVGNHEFNFGSEYLRKVEKEGTFPFLAANALWSDRGESAFRPFIVLERGGVRIGILGLTNPNIPAWELPDYIAGLSFEDPVETARRYVPILRGRERCDVVIVLLHSGFERLDDEEALGGTRGENRAWAMAHEIEGVDLLLTGHTHRLVEPRRIGKTFAATCPAHARMAMRFDLTLRRDAAGALIVEPAGQMIEIDESLAVDEAVVAAARDMHERTIAWLDEVVANLPEPLAVPADRLYDTRLMDVLQAAQLEASGADISIASLLPWNGVEFPAGPLRVRDLFRFYPYENLLVTVQVSGRKVKEFLEWSARYYTGARFEDGRLVIAANPDVSPYNVDFVEGLRYRIDPTRPQGDRVRDLTFRGRPLADDQLVTAALNHYRLAGGGGYAMFADALIVKRAERGVREILIDYLRAHGVDGVTCSGNWYVAPDLVPAPRENR